MEMLLDKVFFKEVTGRVHYIGMERIYPDTTPYSQNFSILDWFGLEETFKNPV